MYLYLYIYMYLYRVWARPGNCANPALQLKLSLKKTAKGTICPLQNLGKKLERKHTHRDLFQYRNWKLKQNMESVFYRMFKVHSKVTFQSCSTEHIHLNQVWWTRPAIVNMSHRKLVRTLESFFAPNECQSESEKNDTEEEQCINQEEADEDQRKPKKSRDHKWLRYEKEAMFCFFCQKFKKTNPFASAEGCTNFCPPKNKNVPQNFSQGDKLSPSDQILAQTLPVSMLFAFTLWTEFSFV